MLRPADTTSAPSGADVDLGSDPVDDVGPQMKEYVELCVEEPPEALTDWYRPDFTLTVIAEFFYVVVEITMPKVVPTTP